MKHRNLAALALVAMTAPAVMALDVEPFDIPIANFSAMGGPHAALADDWSLLFSNPAGLADAQPQLIASQVAAKMTGPLFDIALATLGGGSLIDNFVQVLQNNGYQVYTAGDFVGPLSFGYVGQGIGFGLFNRSHAVVDAASITNISVLVQEDILLVGGYSYGMDLGPKHRLEAGLLAKGFARGGISTTTDVLSLTTIVSNYMAQPFDLETGIGLDLGLRWLWKPLGLSAGIVCRDIYSPVLVNSYSSVQGFIANPQSSLLGSTAGQIPRNLDVGVAWTMPSGGLWGLVDSLSVAVDYGHILDLFAAFSRNPILNLGLGIETRFLDIVSLRAGLAEGYPTAGASLDLAVMKLNLAAWGSELGLEPGSRPAFNLMSSLEFSY
ncbi:MAG TPA: hypothetical protein VMV44_15115 [Rectinemataceae bacterium]|nr:hypothetical protein [Rectinemataceae bacterium]